MKEITKNSSFDLLILGGGILGVSLAYHLRKTKLRILLIEKDESLGLHASGKNAGMIRQLYKSEQLSEWAQSSVKNWPEEVKVKFFNQGSSLVIGRTLPNHHTELFEEKSVLINNKLFPAIYTKTDGLLDSSPYLQYLLNKARENENLSILKKTTVSSLTKSSLRSKNLEVLLDNNMNIFSSILVNCTGAWLDKSSNQLGLQKKSIIKSYARYIFKSKGWGNTSTSIVNSPYGRFNDTSFYWDEAHNWYCRYWGENEKLISKCEEVEANPDNYIPNLNAELKLGETFCLLYPEFSKSISLEGGWHCFRTYAEDKLPIFGFDNQDPRIFWLGGFGGFGMSTSYSATYDAAKLITRKSNNKFKEFSVDRLTGQSSKI